MKSRTSKVLSLILAFLAAIFVTMWLDLFLNNYSISPFSTIYFLEIAVGFTLAIKQLMRPTSQLLLRCGILLLVTIIESLIVLLVGYLQLGTFTGFSWQFICGLLLINTLFVFINWHQYSLNLWQFFLAVLIAVWETLAIGWNFDVASTEWNWLIIIGGLNLLITIIAFARISNSQSWKLATVAGALFALALVLGKPLYETYKFPRLNSDVLIKLGGFIFFWTMVVALILDFLITKHPRITQTSGYVKIQNWFNNLPHPWLLSSSITFIIFIPAIIALAPGIWSYDTPFQYFSMTHGEWSIGQPIASMFIVYIFVYLIGAQLLHSLSLGIFLLIIVQFLLAALIFGYGLQLLNRWHLPWPIQLLAWGWWSLHITNLTSLAQVNTKDTWSALAATLIMIFLLEMWLDQDRFFHSYSKLFILVLAILIFLTFRNSSRLVLLLFIPLWLILCWKYWKKLIALFAVIGVIFVVFNGPVVQHLPSKNANATTGVRALSSTGGLKTQIIFGSYVNAGQHFSAADKSLLWTILPKGTPEQYQRFYSPQFADQANLVWQQFYKSYPYIHRGNFQQRRSQMLKRIIIHYPQATLQAILNLNLGWYYPQSTYPSRSGNIYNEVINETKNGPMTKPGVIINNWQWWPGLYQMVYDLEQNGNYSQYPVIASCFDPACWSWILLIILLALIAQKSWSALLIAAFAMLQWLCLWAAPVVLARYIYPIFLLLPLLLALIYLRPHTK